MNYSKTVSLGPLDLTVAQADSQLSLKLDVGGSLGGGSAAGVVKAKFGGELDLSEKQALELMKALADAAFPKLAPFIDAAVAEMEAVL